MDLRRFDRTPFPLLWHDVAMTDLDRPATASPEPEISYAIARLEHLVLASVSEIAGRYDLTALQFTTLSVLNRHGAPLSSSQLARRSFMTAQSMHEVISRLERGGLIKRNPHPNHRRKRPAILTPKGRRVVTECEAAIGDFEARMLRGFNRTERGKFLAMIKAAVRNLGGGFQEANSGAAEENPVPPAKRTNSPRAA
jgi:DNA-binding MarR family transcriptional regulator